MAHENLKSYLIDEPGRSFVANLTHNVYAWSVKIPDIYINYRIFEEVSIREKATGKTRLDLDYRPHFRFDCVLFIEPGYRALNQRQVYTVGVELKNSKADLNADDKMNHYIGYTDFFFLGVPTGLVEEALDRASENQDGYIGVFSVNDGKIHKIPKRITPQVEHERDLLQQVMFSRMFKVDFKNSISFKVEDIEIVPVPFQDTQKYGMIQSPATMRTQEPSTEPIADGDGRKPEKPFYNDWSDEDYASVVAAAREELREKEQKRQERHKAKIAAIRQEVEAMNGEMPSVVASVLESLPLNDQRVFHVIRKNEGVQAQSVAEMLPELDGIRKPSLATVKRCISALTDAGLIEREGSRKTGRYVAKTVDCDNASCQVCARSPLCRQFQEV